MPQVAFFERSASSALIQLLAMRSQLPPAHCIPPTVLHAPRYRLQDILVVSRRGGIIGQ